MAPISYENPSIYLLCGYSADKIRGARSDSGSSNYIHHFFFNTSSHTRCPAALSNNWADIPPPLSSNITKPRRILTASARSPSSTRRQPWRSLPSSQPLLPPPRTKTPTTSKHCEPSPRLLRLSLPAQARLHPMAPPNPPSRPRRQPARRSLRPSISPSR